MFSKKKSDNLTPVGTTNRDEKMELTERKIKKIPFVSLGVLLMHQAGIDPRTKMHRNTFYAHKRILEAYGFDITQPRKNAKQK